MPDRFHHATEVALVAKPIIKQHHDHLLGRRVVFLFMERFDKDGNSQAIVARGKNLYGKAKLVTVSKRVGKKASGHLLDGRKWRDYPEAAA